MNVLARMNSRELVMGSGGPRLEQQLYLSSGSKSCHKVVAMPAETIIEGSCVTGKLAYYALSSILTIGILVSGFILAVGRQCPHST